MPERLLLQGFGDNVQIRMIMSTKIILLIAIVIITCTSAYNDHVMPDKLSDYHIFLGNPSCLLPGNGFQPYELSAGLFTDHAEKQRLIKVPPGYRLKAVSEGLPDFPEGTILVKTLYYFNDKRDTAKGKRLIETRVLVKASTGWQAGTYVWNKEQTEAVLTGGGVNEPVDWTDQSGDRQGITYHVPNGRECASCHNTNKSLTPIGPAIRNLNINITRNGQTFPQLNYLQTAGILQPADPSAFSTLPDWRNASLPLEQRALAYLDVNCGHCHNPAGYCAKAHLDLRYGHEALKKGEKILQMMSQKEMPLLGTTIVDEEGLELISTYLKSAKK